MTDKLKRMASNSGFCELFWETLREYRKAGSTISQREIFEQLNDYWESEIGEPRFISYDAFRKVRDKKQKLEN